MVQTTSLTALADHVGAGQASKQDRLLLKLWLEHPMDGLTDREAERFSGIRANTVSARRNGLIVRWRIQSLPMRIVSIERKCTVTGRLVNAWRVLAGRDEQLRLW